MEKCIIALSMAFATAAYAQEPMKVNITGVCSDFASITATAAKYQELPFIRGRVNTPERSSYFVLYLNAETRTWTYSEQISDSLYCVIASGEGIEPVPDVIVQEYKDAYGRNNKQNF
jgi:hypothetical protein